jgi:hypothetical protein
VELNLMWLAKPQNMNKKNLMLILVLLAVVSVAYAVYKASAVTMTTIETGRTVVYGQPQHGLTLGLCLFAGLCVIGASLLALDDRYRPHTDGHAGTTGTTTTSSNKVATNYPR